MKKITLIITCAVLSSLTACTKTEVKPENNTVLIVPSVEPLLEPTEPTKPKLNVAIQRDVPSQDK